jgi:regulatory protein
MPQITKLQAQKNPKFINIFLDHQFTFSLPLEEVYRQKLKTGLQLTKEQSEKLLKLGNYAKLLDRTIKYISFRPRSEKEITDWLIQKVKLLPGSLTFSMLIKKLKQLDLHNDRKFAEWWIKQRQTFKPRGPRLLRQELRQKGVSLEIVDQVLEKIPRQTENIRQLMLKKIQQIKKTRKTNNKITKEQNKDITSKLRNFLLRKGYHYDQIKTVIDELPKKT